MAAFNQLLDTRMGDLKDLLDKCKDAKDASLRQYLTSNCTVMGVLNQTLLSDLEPGHLVGFAIPPLQVSAVVNRLKGQPSGDGGAKSAESAKRDDLILRSLHLLLSKREAQRKQFAHRLFEGSKSSQGDEEKARLRWRKSVLVYYELCEDPQAENPQPKKDVFGIRIPQDADPRLFKTGHLYSRQSDGIGLDDLDLEPEDMHSPRNLLFWPCEVEYRYGRLEVCFFWDKVHEQLIFWVLNPAIMDEPVFSWTKQPAGSKEAPPTVPATKFRNLHGQPLLLPKGKLPFRRVLDLQAQLAHDRAAHKGWIKREAVKQRQSIDVSPRKPSVLNDLSAEIGRLELQSEPSEKGKEEDEEEDAESRSQVLKEDEKPKERGDAKSNICSTGDCKQTCSPKCAHNRCEPHCKQYQRETRGASRCQKHKL